MLSSRIHVRVSKDKRWKLLLLLFSFSSLPVFPLQLWAHNFFLLCLMCSLKRKSYHWAKQASIRSSCCNAVGPGFSEWPALYPGSCWVLPSTAPYLYQQNASFSFILFLVAIVQEYNGRGSVVQLGNTNAGRWMGAVGSLKLSAVKGMQRAS